MRRTSCLVLCTRLQRVDRVIVNRPYSLFNMRKFLKKLKGKFSTKGATSSPVPGASSAEPAPRSSSVESIVTPAPAPAVVAEPEVAAAPSSNAGFSTVWNGVLDVLRIAQASLDSVPVPGLKSAIGGFLEIVRQLDSAQMWMRFVSLRTLSNSSISQYRSRLKHTKGNPLFLPS
ncbi:uncharacterized protein EI90DRAFT_1677110 [Cantharellus anzutake]|uniref:uncharacterized protein n=1 Tax=Cantharellus anzutake TaxID=1750568 RepID=UPI0019084648|nr:uncharacterized protein EI90DRAFT_1677110 [Cantharellus anzutake]KAF8327722.1 hypothetical protein EI90DRAFT_1677110 [Cantharellus anzutake]